MMDDNGRVSCEEAAEALRKGFMAAREIQSKMVLGTITTERASTRPEKKKSWLYRLVGFLNEVIDTILNDILEDIL